MPRYKIPRVLFACLEGAGQLRRPLWWPSARPFGDLHPRSGDPAVLLGPGLLRAVVLSATPPALVPEQRGGDPIDRKVAVLDDDALFHPGEHPAARTPLRGGPCLDVDSEHRAVTVRAQHHDVGQVDEDRAGTRRVLVHGGSPGSGGVRSRDSGGPRFNSGGSQTLLNSEVPTRLLRRPSRISSSHLIVLQQPCDLDITGCYSCEDRRVSKLPLTRSIGVAFEL